MKLYKNPSLNDWPKITARNQTNLSGKKDLVSSVFNDVSKNGDQAVIKYARKFDRFKLNDFVAEETEINTLARKTDKNIKDAVDVAYRNIKKFHLANKSEVTQKTETTSGVICWQEIRPIEKVGLYVPGGSAPLISTVLMLGLPAKIAGCKDIVMCSPPDSLGGLNPAMCYAAKKVGIKRIYKLGGVQAIAAMAVGTKTVPKVDKIYGPGNQYVMAAKQYAINYGAAIDMPAGPSEVMVIADKFTRPDFVAADLLSQAEHGPDSQVVLVTSSRILVKNVKEELTKQLELLPRKEIAKESIKNSFSVVLDSEESMIKFADFYAPEHLIISIKNPSKLAVKISNAGSVFLGSYSPESAGDYASGTNHTLPTSGWAKSCSGLSVKDFQRTVSFQKISKSGLGNLSDTVISLAQAEGLEAHANAVRIRLDNRSKSK